MALRLDLAARVLGDDHVVRVSSHPDFDGLDFRFFKKHLEIMGMKYDTPQKDGLEYSFVSWHEVDFLKRRLVMVNELGFTAQLDVSSLAKMTSSYCKSKLASKQEQVLGVCTSFLLESFLYGREKFEEHKRVVEEWLKEEEIGGELPKLVHSFDGLREKYHLGTFSVWEQ